MASEKGVMLLDFPFGQRTRGQKSELLLKSNPVYGCGARLRKLKGDEQEAAKKEMIETKRRMERESVAKTLYDPKKVSEFVCTHKKEEKKVLVVCTHKKEEKKVYEVVCTHKKEKKKVCTHKKEEKKVYKVVCTHKKEEKKVYEVVCTRTLKKRFGVE